MAGVKKRAYHHPMNGQISRVTSVIERREEGSVLTFENFPSRAFVQPDPTSSVLIGYLGAKAS